MADIFVSYAHADDNTGYVKKFGENLRKFLPMFDRECPRLFLDHEMNPLNPWQKIIEEALQSASILIVMSSPNYLRSKWCLKEWDAYLNKTFDNLADGQRVAIVEILPISKNEIESKKLPNELTDPRKIIDMFEKFTPIPFYRTNERGIPIPLGFLYTEVSAEKTPDFDKYFDRIWELAYRISEVFRKFHQDNSVNDLHENENLTLEDINSEESPSSSILGCDFADFCVVSPGNSAPAISQLILRLKAKGTLTAESLGEDQRDGDRVKHYLDDNGITIIYDQREPGWFRETIELACRSFKHRRHLSRPMPRGVSIVANVDDKDAIYEHARALLAFCDLEIVSFEEALTQLGR